jgi:hypothetical protein
MQLTTGATHMPHAAAIDAIEAVKICVPAAVTKAHEQALKDRPAPRMTSEDVTQPVRTTYLIAAVLVLSTTVFIVTKLREANLLTLETARIFAFVVFTANVAVGLIGAFTSHRVAWLSYLAASVASMFLLGMATPLTGGWLVIRVAARVIFLGDHLSLF